jgi:ELWxxDGT repeat protein
LLIALIGALCAPSAALAGGNQPYLVKDINPTGFSSSMYLTKVGNRVFFNAKDGVHGQELWVSDGTDAGTYLVLDLIPGPDGSVPQMIIELNGKAVFHADNNQNGMDWYISDGTAAGTTRLGDIDVGGPGLPPEICGFWDFPSGRVNSVVFYRGSDPTHGRELWKTDGTPSGTGLLKDIRPGVADSSPADFGQVGDLVYFEADDDLWKSDGTDLGTVRLSDVYPLGIVGVGSKAFFIGDEGPDGPYGFEPYVSDGTPEGTHILKDINPGDGWSDPTAMTRIDDLLYFSAYSPGFGREWWVSDGTEEGTVMMMDLLPGPGSSSPERFIQVEETVFFLATDVEHGRELWKTDGTPEGTMLVKDINPGVEDSDPTYFVSSYSHLYFWANDAINGNALWCSDGTETGTQLIADFSPSTSSGFGTPLTVANGLLFFGAGELWALDTRPPPIPTVSAWSMVILILFTLIAGSLVVIRRNEGGSVSGQQHTLKKRRSNECAG